jgi:hypothetical protein
VKGNSEQKTGRERISDVGLRLLFGAYAGGVLIYGASWIQASLTPAENDCKTGILPADPRAALFIGALTAVVMILSGYFAWRPPQTVRRLAGAIAALAIVSYGASQFVFISHVDWCGAFQG